MHYSDLVVFYTHLAFCFWKLSSAAEAEHGKLDTMTVLSIFYSDYSAWLHQIWSHLSLVTLLLSVIQFWALVFCVLCLQKKPFYKGACWGKVAKLHAVVLCIKCLPTCHVALKSNFQESESCFMVWLFLSRDCVLCFCFPLGIVL